MSLSARRASLAFVLAVTFASSRAAFAQTEPLPPLAAATPAEPPPPRAAALEAPTEAPPQAAPAGDRPRRHGFTMELGIGAALTHVAPEIGPSQTSFGLAPLSLSLGGFVSPDVAILARLAGTSYFDTAPDGTSTQYVNGYYGIHVQYWVNDRVMLSAGPGLALFGENAFFAPSKSPHVGYGASLRAGYALLAIEHHALRVSIEAFPAKFDTGFVFGSALNLEWQYF